MAGVQVGRIAGAKEHQIQVLSRLGGIEQATVLKGGNIVQMGRRTALQGGEKWSVFRFQLRQSLVDGGYPLVWFCVTGQSQRGNFDVIPPGIVVLNVHRDAKPGWRGGIRARSGLAGHQPPAQQSQGAGQNEKQKGRAFLFVLKDIPNAVLRLFGGAREGGGEGGVKDRRRHRAPLFKNPNRKWRQTVACPLR